MRLQIDTATGAATADLDRPAHARALAVLTHGAFGGVGSVDLLAVRDSLIGDGVAVALVTQPYRVAGRRTPPTAAVQDAAWLAVIAALRRRRGFATVPLVVGGRSNGARVACRTAGVAGAAGVVTLAFPVHPPGKPETSRLDELAAPARPGARRAGRARPVRHAVGGPEPPPGGHPRRWALAAHRCGSGSSRRQQLRRRPAQLNRQIGESRFQPVEPTLPN